MSDWTQYNYGDQQQPGGGGGYGGSGGGGFYDSSYDFSGGQQGQQGLMIKILNPLSNFSAHDEKFKTLRISSLSIL